MKRKVMSLLMAAVMTASLIGCGSAGTDTPDVEPAAPAGTIEEVEEATDAAEEADKPAPKEVVGIDALEDVSEPVTLSLMVTTRPSTDSKDFFLDWLPELVHEKFPNITIEVEQLPSDEYKQTVRMKYASGEGPDLFTWWPQLQAVDLVEAGYVRDISDFSLLGKFDQSIADLYAFDGKNYGVPLGTSFLTTWYNKDMFADAGVTELPQNYDEFVEVCEKLKAKGYTPIVCGDKDAFVIQFGVYQLGAGAIYPDNIDFDAQLFTGETKFTDDVWVDTVTKFANLYEKGYVMENTLGISQQQSRQSFIDGEAAMIFDGSFGYAAMMAEGAADFERGMFCIPGNDPDGEYYYNWTPANALFTSNISDELHKQACDLVMQYWFNEESPLFEKWVENTTNIICYEGVEDPREMINEYLERYKDSTNLYDLNNAWPEGVSDALTTNFQNVITGDATPEEVCEQMQMKFEEVTE